MHPLQGYQNSLYQKYFQLYAAEIKSLRSLFQFHAYIAWPEGVCTQCVENILYEIYKLFERTPPCLPLSHLTWHQYQNKQTSLSHTHLLTLLLYVHMRMQCCKQFDFDQNNTNLIPSII